MTKVKWLSAVILALAIPVTTPNAAGADWRVDEQPASGPRSQSSLIPLVLPTGSTGSRDGNWEFWDSSEPFAETVQMIRAQLPIRKSFLGLPWCSGEPFGTMQMWDWKSSAVYIMVSVNDRSEITIFNGPDTSGRGDCY